MTAFQASTDVRIAQAVMIAITASSGLLNLLLLVAGLRTPQVRQKPFNFIMLFTCSCELVMQVTASSSLGISLHSGTTPDGRPLMCHVQGTISTFACAMSLWALTAAALSRYYVIVRQQHLSRRHYTYLLIGVTIISLMTSAPLMTNRVAVTQNGGGLLCAPAWSNTSDARHLYVVVILMLSGSIAISMSFASFYLCFAFVKAHKKSLTHVNAVKWSQTSEIQQLQRLFTVVLMLGICWSPMSFQSYVQAATERPVAKAWDQTSLILAAAFSLYYPIGMWLSSQSIRTAVVSLFMRPRVTSSDFNADAEQLSMDTDTPRHNAAALERKKSIVAGSSHVHSRLLSTPRVSPLHFDGHPRMQHTYSMTQINTHSMSPIVLTQTSSTQPQQRVHHGSIRSMVSSMSTDSLGFESALSHMASVQSQLPRLTIPMAQHSLTLSLPNIKAGRLAQSASALSPSVNFGNGLFIDATTAADADLVTSSARSSQETTIKTPSSPLPPRHPRYGSVSHRSSQTKK